MSAKFQKVRNGVSLRPQTADPSDGENGDIYYSSSLNKFRRYENGVWKNLGSGTGVGDVDILSADLAEDANLADYTQTGLEILVNVGAGEVHGDTAFRLIHQAASTRSFKKTIAVDRNWRGKNNTLQFSVRSSAASANLTVLVRDETNSADLLASTQVTTGRVQFSATTSSGLATLSNVSVADYNSVRVGDTITGAGIPTGTKILTKTLSGLVITLSANATASATVTLSASALPAKQTFTFDVPDNCASMSWTISALQEANLPETYVDDLVVKLTSTAKTTASVSTTTFNTTDWTGYTPAIANLGTLAASNVFYRRVGGTLEVHGRVTSGTTVASTFSLPIPSGLSIDYSKLGGTGNSKAVGWINNIANGAATIIANEMGVLFADGTDTANVYSAFSSVSRAFTKLNGSSVANSSDPVEFYFELPILGWTSNSTTSNTIDLTSSVLVQEPDSELRITGFSQANGSTATRIMRITSAPTAGIITSSKGNAIKFEDDSVNGARITILKSAVYSFNFSCDLASAGGAGVGFSKNSSNLTTDFINLADAERLTSSYEPGASTVATMDWTGPLTAGDVIRLQTIGAISGTNTISSSFLQITQQGKLSQLNPSSDQKIDIPTHELRFEGASARGSTDTAIVKFDTQTLTRGDGFSVINTAANGTVITILKDGKLDVGASVYLNHTNSELVISRNQTTLTAVPTAGSQYLAGEFSAIAQIYNVKWSGAVYKNDVIRIASSTTGGIASYAGNSLCLSLQEQRVAVALSNVVPQFQDADSMVRLNTANGYGSTNTMIRRFSNTVSTIGSDVTYADSATLGASFTVNSDGIYYISYTDQFLSPSDFGLSKNTTQPTTSIVSLSNISERLAMVQNSTSGYTQEVCWSGFLNKGDVVRPHGDGTTTGSQPGRASFTIAKTGKPSISAVDVTPFVNLKAQDYELIQSAFTPVSTYGSTNTGVALFTLTKNTNKGVIRVDSSATAGHSFTALKDCRVTVAASAGGNGTGIPGVYITKNETVLTAAALTPSAVMAYCAIAANNNSAYAVSTFEVIAGDVIRIQRDSTNLQGVSAMSLFAVADSTSIVSAAKSYRMSDYLATGTRVTGVDPANLGEYRTQYRATVSNSAQSDNTSLATLPSVANGMFIAGNVAYNASGTASVPYFYKIFIGKNKSYKMEWFSATGRTGQMSPDFFQSSTTEVGAATRYDPTTGVLEVDGAFVWSASNSTRYLGSATAGVGVGTGYFDVVVFDTPFVSASFTRRLAYIRDEKTAGTNGGTFTSGAYQTRDLNTLVDSSGIVTTLSGNAFTLPAGKYRIKARAPAFRVDAHQAKLRNTTDSTDVILGSVSYSGSAASYGQTDSVIEGEFSISASKTFSILHQCATTFASGGFGSGPSFGNNVVFTMVEIEKLS